MTLMREDQNGRAWADRVHSKVSKGGVSVGR